MKIILQRAAGGVIAAEKTRLNGLLRANRNAFRQSMRDGYTSRQRGKRII
ncbi:MAG: hypothetical protein IIT39_12565 [Clostridia bacterium]|nr:hypothetical protein [Clostridia bacterium]